MGKYTPIPCSEAIPRLGLDDAAVREWMQRRSRSPPRANVTDAGTSLPFTGIVVFLGNDGTYTNRATNDRIRDRGYMTDRGHTGLSPGRMSTSAQAVTETRPTPGAGQPSPVPIADLDDEGLVAHADRHAAFSIL